MRILKIVEWTVVAIVASLAIYIAYIAIMWSGVFIPKPRMPEVKYAEFPLRIEIEFNGERYIYEDAIVCEYDGVGVNEYGSSKYRRWKERFASGKEYKESYPTILLLDAEHVEIKYHSGEGAYYMDKPYYEIEDRGRFDKDNDGTPYSPRSPNIYIYDKRGGSPGGPSSLSFDFFDTTSEQNPRLREVLSKYGVTLISIEQTPPIENIFK